MKLFVVAAMGAALLAGCAPFEHGHYTEDVSYRNTTGDPPGTPLVYRGDVRPTSGTSYAGGSKSGSWGQTAHNGTPRYQGSNRSYASIYDPVVAEQPYITRAYPTVAQSSLAPTYSAPSYTQTAYAAPQSYAPTVQPSYTQPVQQSYVAQQIQVQPAQQSTYAAAPAQHSSHLATTYGGGHRFDADGYAICDIPFESHAAHQTPQFRSRF